MTLRSTTDRDDNPPNSRGVGATCCRPSRSASSAIRTSTSWSRARSTTSSPLLTHLLAQSDTLSPHAVALSPDWRALRAVTERASRHGPSGRPAKASAAAARSSGCRSTPLPSRRPAKTSGESLSASPPNLSASPRNLSAGSRSLSAGRHRFGRAADRFGPVADRLRGGADRLGRSPIGSGETRIGLGESPIGSGEPPIGSAGCR